MSEHVDKRTESQFDVSKEEAKYNMDPWEGGEDPWYSWNPENHEDMLRHYEEEEKKKNK